MKPVVLSYQVSLADYRKMLYFNTFSIRKLQSLFVVLVWMAAAVLLLLDVLGTIQPTQVMHLCFLIVTVAAPMIVVSLEIRVHRSREIFAAQKGRTLILEEDGLKYRTESSHETGFDAWGDVQAVYETKSMFIIYKDGQNIVPVPKQGQEPEKLEKARACLRQKMGNKYKARY